MKLLCLSNGHGEDIVAVRILEALQQQPQCPDLAALPIVGRGLAYSQAGIPVVGPVKTLPSGGFNRDGRQMARDLQGGLLQLTLSQLQVVKTWGQNGGAILAVGDLVPLLFAWWSGAPYAFVGTAKSEYYLRDEAGPLPRQSWFDDRLERWLGSVYYPWERWFMGHRRCKAVFPRDGMTAESLRRFNVPALSLGNPMMDGLEAPLAEALPEDQSNLPAPLITLLLPGSRPPEAYTNWQLMLQAVEAMVAQMTNRPLQFLAAIAPSLEPGPLYENLLQRGWQQGSPTNPAMANLSQTFQQQVTTGAATLFTNRKASLVISQAAFRESLHQAHLAIAMAGTATEQFVGVGKPAFILPGRGPQFTPAFAEAQTRLLGPSVILAQQPAQIPSLIQRLLQDPDRLQIIGENGRHRLGEPGASQRIAAHLVKHLLASNELN